MQSIADPKSLLTSLHFQASGELLRLMDGFYSNIEDGLFEMAYANDNNDQQRRTVELMRELRYRREHLLKVFGKRLQTSVEAWFRDDHTTPEYLEERLQADQIAAKCASHFSGLLQAITERASHATAREMDRRALPISPEEISYHFVMSCRSLELDQMSIGTVQDLFHRFVLDRLGSIYGPINLQLEDAGFYTLQQLESDTAHTA